MQVRRFLCFAAIAAALISVQAHGAFEGDAEAGKAKAAGTCAACHGVDGNTAMAMNPPAPKLAGQIPEYLYQQLKDFKSGARTSPIMTGQAAQLSDKDMRNLAAYYGSQTLKGGAASSEALALAGKRLYRGGNAKTGVSACMSCHGPSGHGIPPRFPRVTGQSAAYTEHQLNLFKAGQRKNDDGVMQKIAFRMSLDEIKAVSEYMSGLH